MSKGRLIKLVLSTLIGCASIWQLSGLIENVESGKAGEAGGLAGSASGLIGQLSGDAGQGQISTTPGLLQQLKAMMSQASGGSKPETTPTLRTADDVVIFTPAELAEHDRQQLIKQALAQQPVVPPKAAAKTTKTANADRGSGSPL